MTHIIGRGRYARETYPDGAPPNFGVPDEIIRYYFRLDSTVSGEVIPHPWAAVSALSPPTVSPLLSATLPVPPGKLSKAALIVVVINPGEPPIVPITGDPIIIQWTGILGANIPPPPGIPVPVPIGAPQQLIDTNVVGALPLGSVIVSNFDFGDVIIPLGGAVLTPTIILPDNLSFPVDAAFECAFSAGIDWNPALINEPFGPQP
jgi:hypothetical protein